MRSRIVIVLAVLALVVTWLQREGARGTFDPIERVFLSWLAANDRERTILPPLTLVLYDEESSELAGADRMAMLDGALFTRAVSLLGAVAAGVEGLPGDPARMIEAARGMPVFGGYAETEPPGTGWSALRGQPSPTWPEIAGLPGRSGLFPRGFIRLPAAGAGGAREAVLVGRTGGRAVPSFLVLTWAAAQGARMRDLTVDGDAVHAPQGKLAVDARGAARFLPVPPASVMTMNDLLVAAEKLEREGGSSPVRGHVVVLARATSDVTRLAGEGADPVTPAELWAQAWEAVRRGRLFRSPGWWYGPALFAAASMLALGPAGRSCRKAVLAGVLAMFVFLLAALGAFAGARVLLPLGPTLCTVVAGLFAGWGIRKAGWM